MTVYFLSLGRRLVLKGWKEIWATKTATLNRRLLGRRPLHDRCWRWGRRMSQGWVGFDKISGSTECSYGLLFIRPRVNGDCQHFVETVSGTRHKPSPKLSAPQMLPRSGACYNPNRKCRQATKTGRGHAHKLGLLFSAPPATHEISFFKPDNLLTKSPKD
jgi:hypothetical protein